MHPDGGYATASSEPEKAAIRALCQALMDGGTRAVASFAAPFAEETNLIGFGGTHLKGRDVAQAFCRLGPGSE